MAKAKNNRILSFMVRFITVNHFYEVFVLQWAAQQIFLVSGHVHFRLMFTIEISYYTAYGRMQLSLRFFENYNVPTINPCYSLYTYKFICVCSAVLH